MTRPSRALIDLDALRNNYLFARQLHGGRALAVIKANAYGHGALPCARALEPVADGFAVAFLDEALALREGGIRKPILLLEGAFSIEELHLACDHDLWLVVHHGEQVRMVEQSRAACGSLNLWMKIDSGMHRAGFALAEAPDAYQRLRDTGRARSITLMTHFARADEPGEAMTHRQIECFDAATANLAGERSLCNSAGLLAWPEARRHWARPGIMLYGVEPCGRDASAMQPVMTFESQVFAVRTLEAGESVGYGAAYVAPCRKQIGVVCVGYADGYPRDAPSGTPVAVAGHQTSVLGRVSMDMLTLDLTDIPHAGVGSAVELWGRSIPVSAVAAAAGRIAYELLCNVGRVPLVYSSKLDV